MLLLQKKRALLRRWDVLAQQQLALSHLDDALPLLEEKEDCLEDLQRIDSLLNEWNQSFPTKLDEILEPQGLQRLLEKISRAEADLKTLKSAYSNDSDNGTEDTSPTFKAFEESSSTLSKEENMKLAERQEKFIRNLKNALIRIENQTYGVCRVTGNLISKERLMLVPHATLSIEAKNSQ